MKTIPPLPIYKESPLLCTPDEMEIYTEIFACHARYKLTRRQSGQENPCIESAGPSDLEFRVLQSPALTGGAIHCRAFGPVNRTRSAVHANVQTPGPKGQSTQVGELAVYSAEATGQKAGGMKGRQCVGPAVRPGEVMNSEESAEGAAHGINQTSI